MKKVLTTVSTTAALALLSISSAFAQLQGTITIGQGAQQGRVNGDALIGLLSVAQTLVTRLVPFAIGVAVIVFFWFLIKFITQSSDPAEQGKSKMGMVWSILALFVMVSIWGLVGFLGSLLGINQGGNVPIPGVPVPAQ